MSISIDDIAREAGVSTATVSRVINKSPKVRPQTIEKVESVMRRLDYLPNSIARSLASKSSKIIGVIVSDITNPVYAETIRAIQDEAEAHGYVTVIFNSDENMHKEREYIKMLLEMQIDGAIFPGGRGISSQYNEHIFELGSKVPVVLANEHLEGANIYSIVCDKRKGAYEMTRHFLSMGHRHIAMVTGYGDYKPSIEKYQGYVQAMEEAGIEIRDDLIIHSNYQMAGGYRAALKLLALKIPPTGIFAANDVMAIGIMRALQRHGIRVPQDIAVAGYDDIKLNTFLYPALTSVSQNMPEIGRRSAKVLVSVLNGEADVPRTQVIQPVLRIRESCGGKAPRPLLKDLEQRI